MTKPPRTLSEPRQQPLDNSWGVRLGEDPRGPGILTFGEEVVQAWSDYVA